MLQANTVVDLLHANAQRGQAITYLEGEHDERKVTGTELTQRALSILHELQAKPTEKPPEKKSQARQKKSVSKSQ